MEIAKNNFRQLGGKLQEDRQKAREIREADRSVTCLLLRGCQVPIDIDTDIGTALTAITVSHDHCIGHAIFLSTLRLISISSDKAVDY